MIIMFVKIEPVAVMICLVIGMLEVPQIVHQFCSCVLVSVLETVHSLEYLSYDHLVLCIWCQHLRHATWKEGKAAFTFRTGFLIDDISLF